MFYICKTRFIFEKHVAYLQNSYIIFARFWHVFNSIFELCGATFIYGGGIFLNVESMRKDLYLAGHSMFDCGV